MKLFKILLPLIFVSFLVQYLPVRLLDAQPPPATPDPSNFHQARELIYSYDATGNVNELDQAIELLQEELLRPEPYSPMTCEYLLAEARVRQGVYWLRHGTTEAGRSAAEAKILEDIRAVWSRATRMDEYPDTVVVSDAVRLSILNRGLFYALMEAGQHLEHASPLAPLMKNVLSRVQRYRSQKDTLSLRDPFFRAKEFMDLDYPNTKFISCVYGADLLDGRVLEVEQKIANDSAMIDSLRRLRGDVTPVRIRSLQIKLDSLKQIDLVSSRKEAADLALAAAKAATNDTSEYFADCLAARNLEARNPEEALNLYYRAISALDLAPDTSEGYLGLKYNQGATQGYFTEFLVSYGLKLVEDGELFSAVGLLRDGFNVERLTRRRRYNIASVLSRALRLLVVQLQAEGKNVDHYIKEQDRVDAFINAYRLSIGEGSEIRER